MITHPERDTILNTYNSHFAGLIKSLSSLRTPTVTEADYTGYGTRPGITFGSVANTSPTGGRQRANSALVTFPQNTGASQDVIAWGLYAASTGGTPKRISFLDSDAPIIGAVDNTTTDQIIALAHGLSVDQRVYVLGAPGMVLPAGLSEDTAYYVGTVPDVDHFTLSTTPANANPVAITARGAAQFIPYTPVTIANNATPEFAIGSLILQM